MSDPETKAMVSIAETRTIARTVCTVAALFVLLMAVCSNCVIQNHRADRRNPEPTFQEVCMQHGGSVYVDSRNAIDCIMPNAPVPAK